MKKPNHAIDCPSARYGKDGDFGCNKSQIIVCQEVSEIAALSVNRCPEHCLISFLISCVPFIIVFIICQGNLDHPGEASSRGRINPIGKEFTEPGRSSLLDNLSITLV